MSKKSKMSRVKEKIAKLCYSHTCMLLNYASFVRWHGYYLMSTD